MGESIVSIVMPNDAVATEAITYLVRIMSDSLRDDHDRTAAAIAILNAYTILRALHD